MFKLVLMLFFFLLHNQLWAQGVKPNLKFSFLDALAERDLSKSPNFDIGNWKINYSKSYITAEKLFFFSPEVENDGTPIPKLALSFDKFVGDYLFFDRKNDVAFYEVRIDGLAAIFDASVKKVPEEPKEESEQKVKITKISFPHRQVLREFFSPRMEFLIKNIKGNPNFNIPLVLTDFKIENLDIFPPATKKPLYALLTSRGKLFDGDIAVRSRFNIFYDEPILDIDLRVTDVSLIKLNAIFRQYGGIEITDGRFSVFIEAAVKNQRVEGYVKLISRHADLQDYWDKDESFFQNLKAAFVDMGIELLDRTDKDRIAGRIPFGGEVPEVRANFWQFIESLMVNAVFSPLQGGLSNSINLETVDEKENKND